ncbi:hypothetical protein MXB_5054 [Myxobolus squamalis]|nr:hypothetical protein MXB_5054 [Myxobolus squamalis]
MFLCLLVCFFLCIPNYFLTPEGVKGPIIGIDLGTTYSCVGIFRNGHVDIIQNDQGNRITPSYVAFTPDGEKLVGDSAKNQLTVNPENTVYDAKRLIGRRFDEPSVLQDIKYWPFKVVNKNGRPYIQVKVGDTVKTFAPEEISAMVLSRLRDFAQDFLKVNITDAVITVPAYFSNEQRQSTKDAGTIANLNVVRIINEPTAAALAYGVDHKQDEYNILVFDLGGGTYDVSVLSVDSGVFEVAATSGDTHLGGEDFDNRLVNHIVDKIKAAKRKIDFKDVKTIQKLRREVEKAKRALSKVHETTLEIELTDGDFSISITRSKFEQINDDLFQKTLAPLKKCIEDSSISIENFNEILLVGGSTRIPKIQQMVRDFFNGKEPNRGINPDEAVAYGAAVQGAIISGDASTGDVVLIDVNPLSLGIKVSGDVVERIIMRNTKIPTKQTKTFTTVSDNQDVVRIEVYEGERSMSRDNNKLGEFDITGIRKAPRGVPQIEVTFTIDHNGIIHVEASEKASGVSNKITISNEKRQLKQEEIDRMISESQKYAEEDQKTAQRVKAKSDLESNLYSIKNQMKEESGLGGKLTAEEKTTLEAAVDESISWLDKNPSGTAEEIKEQKTIFEKVATPILSRYSTGQPQQPTEEKTDGDKQDEREEL